MIFVERAPGQTAVDVSEAVGVPAVLIGGPSIGTMVKRPPELGGTAYAITAITTNRCPTCPAQVAHMHFADRVVVAECTACGFVWYAPRG